MKILIVDDEYFARKALVQIVQDWNPQVTVYEAEDGREAVNLLADTNPDLVLSDIRMPLLDGIELAAYIHEQHPETSNIIISGYDDFAYAQQAIRYKVEHYLLKPVDKTHIWSLLEPYRDKCALSAEKRMEERLDSLLYDGNSGVQLYPDFDCTCYAAAALRADAVDKEQLKQAVKQTLSACGLQAVVIGDRRYADMIIVWWSFAGSTEEWLGNARHLFERVVSNPALPGECSVTVGISRVHTGREGLAVCCKEAKNALLYRLIAGDNRVYDAAFTGIHRSFNYTAMDDSISSVHQKLLKGQTAEADFTLRRYLTDTVRLDLSVSVLHDLCAKITVMLNSVIELANSNSDTAETFLEQMDLHEYASIEQIADSFSHAVARISKRLLQNRAKADMVEDIQRYVRLNYKQDIMLEDLARNMYFTDPAYLSRVFKKKTGIPFSQFLLSVRMHNAKAMLENDASLTVSEVSGAVGFNDYSHFIQMYKKMFGETPGKYRSNSKQAE